MFFPLKFIELLIKNHSNFYEFLFVYIIVIGAHIFDIDKNMRCIFEITTINKQKQTGKILSGRNTSFDDIDDIG